MTERVSFVTGGCSGGILGDIAQPLRYTLGLHPEDVCEVLSNGYFFTATIVQRSRMGGVDTFFAGIPLTVKEMPQPEGMTPLLHKPHAPEMRKYRKPTMKYASSYGPQRR
jgi:hypothetical protein